MKRILFFAICMMILGIIVSAQWSSGWTTIFTDNVSQNVSVPLDRFPYVVNGSYIWFPTLNMNTTGGIQADCGDLRIIDKTGSFSRNTSIELCNSTKIVIWSNINLSAGANSSINQSLYAGNLATDSDTNACNVWDSNYTLVWHLTNTSASFVKDDTCNGNNATFVGNSIFYNSTENCVFGQCITFTGPNRNEYINASDPFKDYNYITVEFWAKPRYWQIDGEPLGQWYPAGANSFFTFSQINSATMMQFSILDAPLFPHSVATDITNVAVNEWHYFVGTYDNASLRIFVDGNLTNTTSFTGKIYDGATTEFLIGRTHDGSVPWNGSIDEVRVSSINRSSEYIWQNWIMGRDKAMSKLGNANQTDNIAPVITIMSPANRTNESTSLTFNFTITEGNLLGQCKYSLNNAVNVSLINCQNASITAVEGFNTITVWANDSFNNTGSDTMNWVSDTIAPVIVIQSPTNSTVSSGSTLLNYTITEANFLSQCWYSIDEGTNTSLISCQNTTFIVSSGSHKVRIYANDTINQTGNSDINWTVNSAPVITTFNITIINITSTKNNITLNASLLDTDNNIIDFSFISGYIRRVFSNLTMFLDISNLILPFYAPLVVNDTNNLDATYIINFTFWNTSLIQNSTVNLTYQIITQNVSIQNNNSKQLVNVTFNLSSPVNATRIRGESISGIELNGTYTNKTEWSGDWIREQYTSEMQDTDFTTTANGTSYTKILFNSTNTLQVTFNNVNISSSVKCRSGRSQNATLINISASGIIVNQTIGCTVSKNITLSRNVYNITDPNVTVDINSNGYLETIINNTDRNISFNSVLVNISSNGILQNNWNVSNNATGEREYLFNITNGTESFRNTSIVTTTPLAVETTSQSANCSAFTLYSNYCTQQTDIVQIDSTHWRKQELIRTFLNVSDPDLIVKQKPIVYKQSVSRFNNIAGRESGSLKYRINGTLITNGSIDVESSNVNIFIDINATASSLSEGMNYVVEVEYTWISSTSPSNPPSSGGPAGGGLSIPDIPQIIYLGGNVSGTFYLNPSSVTLNAQQGNTKNWSIILTNTNNNPVIVNTKFLPVADNSYKWAVFKKDIYTYTETTYLIGRGTVDRPNRTQVDVVVGVPLDINNGSYQFNAVFYTDSMNKSTNFVININTVGVIPTSTSSRIFIDKLLAADVIGAAGALFQGAITETLYVSQMTGLSIPKAVFYIPLLIGLLYVSARNSEKKKSSTLGLISYAFIITFFTMLIPTFV